MSSNAGIEFRITRSFLPDDEKHQPVKGATWDPQLQMWFMTLRSLEELLALRLREGAELLVSSEEILPHTVVNKIEICDFGHAQLPYALFMRWNPPIFVGRMGKCNGAASHGRRCWD